MTLTTFDRAITLTPSQATLPPATRPELCFDAALEDSWRQGKGVYGGLQAALFLRAFDVVVGDARRTPRSLTVHFCAPAVPGPARLRAWVDRQGASVSHLSAVLENDRGVLATSSSTYSSPRPEPHPRAVFANTTPPAATPFGDVEPIPADLPLLPTFTQHFEYRMALGQPAYSSSDEAFFGAWLTPREPRALDAALCAALLDALPPAVLSRLDAPRAASSVDFTCRFLAPFDALPQTPALVTAHSLVGDGGYTEEENALWVGDRLVATCHQLVALL